MTAERHPLAQLPSTFSAPVRSPAETEWRYELHLYLDYGFPQSVLPTLLPALAASFPIARLTHSQLSPLQHLELLLACWEADRYQLNALGVLNVLEQQWEAGGRAAAKRADASADGSNGRQHKRRKSNDGRTDINTATKQSADALLSNSPPVGGSSVTRFAGTASTVRGAPYTSSNRFSTERRAEYVVATRYATTTFANISRSFTDERDVTKSSTATSLRSPCGPYMYECLSDLRQSNIDHKSCTVRYSLFLTEYDCYVPGLTFVFGVARLTRCALVSMHRLDSNSPEATAAFLAKECVHEIGHLFSLQHCDLPCVMTYSTSVEEARCKNAYLCPSCEVKLQWMQRGVIIKPRSQRQPPVGSVEHAAAEAIVSAQVQATYR